MTGSEEVWVNYAERIGAGAPVYVAAVVEYLTAEVLELARNTAHDSKNTYVIPCQLQLVIRANEELSKFLGGVTIAQGGVLANIQGTFLLKKSKMKASKKD
ncbi:core histone H2A/H2B/H3/H4 [Trichuris suis]|nr:core histone H2A/H2B/H3/H4 [Trichuris suis]